LKTAGLKIAADIKSASAEPITSSFKKMFPESLTVLLTTATGSVISILDTLQGTIDIDVLASYSAAIGLGTKPLGAQTGDASLSIGTTTSLISMNLPGDRVLCMIVPNGARSIDDYIKKVREYFT
jgi:hypothetical protein